MTLRSRESKLGREHPNTLVSRNNLAKAHVVAGQFDRAEPLLRECLAIRTKTQPDVWSTFSTQSLLGGSLLGQGKFAEAEPLVVSGYEGLKAREARIPRLRGNCACPRRPNGS